MIASLGASAAVLAVYGAMTAQVTGLWAALVIWWTGTSVGWAGATAAILSGPWGWIILGCAILAMYYGNDYYKREAERNIREIKENLTIAINANMPIMIHNWEKLFNAQ